MQAAEKTHRTKTTGVTLRFRPRTPSRIIKRIEQEYGDYLEKDDGQETVDPFSTEWYRDITGKTTPGDRLNTERFKASMTQIKLAELTGIPQHHISEMEHGKRPIGRETARKLAKVFKTDYRYFL